MKIENKCIDELIESRKEARIKRNWRLSDRIRNYLDTKHVFIFDTEHGQIVYHRNGLSRPDLIDQIKKEDRAEKLFDAWLFSMSRPGF